MQDYFEAVDYIEYKEDQLSGAKNSRNTFDRSRNDTIEYQEHCRQEKQVKMFD
jgi:hypothetical protein